LHGQLATPPGDRRLPVHARRTLARPAHGRRPVVLPRPARFAGETRPELCGDPAACPVHRPPAPLAAGPPDGLLPWRGDQPVRLDATKRHLVVIHAVWDGRFALFDTKTDELLPFGEA